MAPRARARHTHVTHMRAHFTRCLGAQGGPPGLALACSSLCAPRSPSRGRGGRATGRVGRHICGRNPEVGCRGHPSAGSFPITQLSASRGHSPSHPYYKLQSMDKEARRVSATGPEGQRAGLCARPPTAELRACGLVQSWDDSAASPPARLGACPGSDQPCDRSGQPGPERNLSNTWGGVPPRQALLSQALQGMPGLVLGTPLQRWHPQGELRGPFGVSSIVSWGMEPQWPRKTARGQGCGSQRPEIKRGYLGELLA